VGSANVGSSRERTLTLSSTSKRDIVSVLAGDDVLLLLSARSLVGRGEWIGSSASDSLSFFSARGDSGECDFSPFTGLVVVSTTATTALPLCLVGDSTSVDLAVRGGTSSLLPSSSSAEAVPVLEATAATSDPFSASPPAGSCVSQVRTYTSSVACKRLAMQYLRRTARAAANFAGPIGSQRYCVVFGSP
jgi:hypothetical protein